MATQKNFLDDDEQGQSLGQGQSVEASTAGGGSAQSAAPAQQGTGWNNLQQYITMNQGGGEGIANDITKDVQSKVDDADNSAKAWETAAKGRVDQATKQDKYGDTIKNGDVAGIDQGAFDAWKKLGAYTGMNNAAADSDYGSVYGKTQQAKNNVAGVQDYDTQKALVNNAYNKGGNYTSGMGTLDTFIMRGDKAGQQALQQFQDKNKNVGAGFDQARTNIDSYIGGASARGQQANDSGMNAINQRRQSIQDAAQERLGGVYNQARDAASKQADDYYRAAGVDPSRFGGAVSRAGDISWQDALGDTDLAALNALSNIDDDVNTNAMTKPTRSIANVDWDRVKQNVAMANSNVGKTVDQTPQTHEGTVFTPTGERYDANYNRIDSGAPDEELINRILGGFSGV